MPVQGWSDFANPELNSEDNWSNGIQQLFKFTKMDSESGQNSDSFFSPQILNLFFSWKPNLPIVLRKQSMYGPLCWNRVVTNWRMREKQIFCQRSNQSNSKSASFHNILLQCHHWRRQRHPCLNNFIPGMPSSLNNREFLALVFRHEKHYSTKW